MNKLSWIFELIDRVSAPANAASSAISRVESTMNAAGGATDRLAQRQTAMGTSATRAGARASTGMGRIRTGITQATSAVMSFGSRIGRALGAIPGMSRAAAAGVGAVRAALRGAELAGRGFLGVVRSIATAPLSRLAGAIAPFAAALGVAKGQLDAIVNRSRTLMALEITTGRQGDGGRVYERARRLSEQLGTDLNETFSSVQNLLSKGLGEEQVFALVQGMADITTLSPDANLQRMALAISQIHQTGFLQGDELNQLAESGLPLEHVYERIGAAMGVAASEVRGLRGTVPAAVALEAILGGIAETTGSDLGGVAEQMSHTLGGEIQRLTQAPDRFFERVAAGNTQTSERLTSAVRRLNEFLNPESAQGQRVVNALSEALEHVVSMIEWATANSETMSRVLDGLGIVLTPILWTLTGMAMILYGVAYAAEYVSGGLTHLFSGIVAWMITTNVELATTIAGWQSKFQAFAANAYNFGRDIVQGLVNGLISMQFAPATVIGSMADNMITTLRTALGIRSPSRVFAYMGEMTGLGFNEGLESTGMGIGLNGEMQTPALGSPQAMAALGGATINLTINVNGSDDDRETADTIGEIVMSRLAQAFDSLALETGV